jgi:hypothetical protein
LSTQKRAKHSLKEHRVKSKTLWIRLFVCSVLLFGCASWRSPDPQRYDRRRPMESTLEKPVVGPLEERVYHSMAFARKKFDSVTVEAPKIVSTAPDDASQKGFLQRLEQATEEGARRALEQSGRFGKVWVAARELGPEPAASATFLTTEMMAHIAYQNGRIVSDPALRDPRSKLICIYTLKERATGKVIFRVTTMSQSFFEYGDAAMGELEGTVMAELPQDLLQTCEETWW